MKLSSSLRNVIIKLMDTEALSAHAQIKSFKIKVAKHEIIC
jgi:hypothetical protein